MLEIFIFALENITHVQNETMTHEDRKKILKRKGTIHR